MCKIITNFRLLDSRIIDCLFFQDEKAVKLNALNARIEEVIAYKESLICERKELMHDKMAKAEAKRQEYLNFIYLLLSLIILLLLFIYYFYLGKNILKAFAKRLVKKMQN